MQRVRERTKRTALTALLTALVAVVTMSFSLYVPQTRGYFNIGESMVYLAALVAGPTIGGFAGGVGSMIADVVLGYFVYAPATLVIKGLEGFAAGWLAKKTPRISLRAWRLGGAFVSACLAIVLLTLGVTFFTGPSELYVGLPWQQSTLSVELYLALWVAVAFVAALTIALPFFKHPESVWQAIALSISGSLMIAGYFIYEYMLVGLAAFAEVPFNIMQVLIGMTVALAVFRPLKAAIQ